MQQEVTFIIEVDAQEMRVCYRPRCFANYAHFEFKSLHNPPGRIPLSETGYRSHFSPMHEIEAAPSVETYAEALAVALMGIKPSPDEEDTGDQLTLF